MTIHFESPQALLSRKRIRERITQLAARSEASVDRHDLFLNTVRHDAARGDLLVRNLGTVLTVPIDGVIGNGRSVHHSIASYGVVPLMPLVILEEVSPALSVPISNALGTLSAVPKAILSAVGNAVGGAEGVLRGAYRAAHYKAPAVDHKPGEPCKNETTFLMQVPTQQVEPRLFFRCEKGYGFDVEELQGSFEHGDGWSHPHLPGEEFSRTDRKNILQHPAVDGRLVRKLTIPRAQRSDITAATVTALEVLDHRGIHDVHVMKFYAYYTTLPERERLALDALLPMPHEKLSEALHNLVTGNYCNAAFGRALVRGLAKLRAA